MAEQNRQTQWLAAWQWAPLILLLTLEVKPLDVVHLSGSFLIIPLAALMARRCGKSGVLVLALFSLPLLVEFWSKGFGTRGAPGLYLSGLIIAWWIFSHRSASFRLQELQAKPWIYIGLFLLPLKVGLGSIDLNHFSNINIVWDGYPLFFLLVFAIGYFQLPWHRFLIPLTAAALFGITLEYLPPPASASEFFDADRVVLPWLGLIELTPFFANYQFDTPAEFLTAAGFFALGRFYAKQSKVDNVLLPSSLLRVCLLFGAILLAFGGEIGLHLFSDYDSVLKLLGKNSIALLLAGILAGLYFRFAGILAASFLTVFFWWLNGFVHAEFNLVDPHIYFRFDQLFYIFGFGLLGIGMRDTLQRSDSKIWSWSWFRFSIVYLLLLFSLIELNSSYSLLAIVTLFLLGISLALVLVRVREKFSKTEIEVRGGWLSLACLLIVGYLTFKFSTGLWENVLQFSSEVIKMISQLFLAREVIDEEDLLITLILIEACLFVLLFLNTSIEKLLVSIRQFTHDVGSVLELMWKKKFITFRFQKSESTPPSEVDKENDRFTYLKIFTWINRTLIACIILLPMTVAVCNYWLVYQEDLARDKENREFSERKPEAISEARRKYIQEETELKTRLVLGVRNVMSDYPDLQVDQGKYATTVTTGWYSDPHNPEIRRRASISIRPGSRFREQPIERVLTGAIRVNLSRQDKGRFGLWGEQKLHPDWREERTREEELKQKIVATVLAEGQD